MLEPVFDKVAGLQLVTLSPRNSGTGVFSEFCETFKRNFFQRTPPGDCFLFLTILKLGHIMKVLA